MQIMRCVLHKCVFERPWTMNEPIFVYGHHDLFQVSDSNSKHIFYMKTFCLYTCISNIIDSLILMVIQDLTK